LARAYADRALALLREAVKRGLKDAPMEQDTDLDPLRARHDFRDRVRELAAVPGRP